MRARLTMLALLLASGAFAQPSGNQSETPKPTLSVVVKTEPSGANLLTVTSLRSDYPPELMRSQCQRLAQLSGGEARGLYVYPYKISPDTVFVRAEFATDNLVDYKTGYLRLEPIVKAFAGAKRPYTVQAMRVQFEAQRPAPETVRDFESDAVILVGSYMSSPPGTEYTILLKSQDPDKISIPISYTPPEQTSAAKPAPQERPWLLYGLIVLGSLSAGALVYFLLLHADQRASRR